MPKIVLIGAGSVVFAKTLIADILSFPSLQQSTIALVDVNAERLALMAAFTRRLIEQQRLPTQIEVTTDRTQALAGADYVITVIQIGGVRAYELDIEIPRRHGVDQAVGDTIGPGGVFRGLRSLPALVAIARDMERLCPEAWLLNYTNPLAINVWGLYRSTPVRVMGLCHSVQATAAYLARTLGVPYDKLRYWAAGINHLAWFLTLEYNGHDLYPALRRRMHEAATIRNELVRASLLRLFGYWVSESSYHCSEYLPYFRRTPELRARFFPIPRDYLAMYREGLEEQRQATEAQLAGCQPLPVRRSHEYASYIIDSLHTNSPRRFNLNVRNDQLIDNLPAGACVEVPCLVDGSGLHPCRVGSLPPQCAALDRLSINVQELAVEAALTGNPRAVRQALALDPLTASLLRPRQIRVLANEMLMAQAEWLPQFESGVGIPEPAG
ncbi:MAG: alpha-glucosidase/alpha-galactosidase [Anaerolineae bacterium]